jgi:hypothetical protein
LREHQPFVSIHTEGGILPSDLLSRIAELAPEIGDLTPESYHLYPSERIRDAITRSWQRLEGIWTAFQSALAAGGEDGLSRRWLLALFAELGYGQLQPARAMEIDGRSYPVSHAWDHVLIHLVSARASLDARTAGVVGAARRSPHALVQEVLNRTEDYLWGFVSNGLLLRLLRDNETLTRQAFVEFDLDAMFSGGEFADFAVLWLVCHQSRLEGDPPEKCILERWSTDAARQGARALDQLRDGVETAIKELGAGFLTHRDNAKLRERLADGTLNGHDYYRQLLRLVYRLLFVLVAEARDLLFDTHADATARARYQQWYSLERLRRVADESRGGPHTDLWQQLRVVFRGLSSAHGEPALGLPGLGSFLWSEHATPDLDTAELANRSLLTALRALTWLTDERERVRRPIDYRNLGSEELGSVYESLLELHPEVDITTGQFSLKTERGHERKTTGSYYTPSSLISVLLDTALEPVLDNRLRSAGRDPARQEAALLGVTVLDPACGSGHFLIAAAQRIAARLASLRTGEEEPTPAALRVALRDVVGRCLHGIDVNEMAVELCKVSLWMEAMEPGRPLTFLENKIVHGNSLLGATPRLLASGIPDEAFKPLEGDEKTVVATLKKDNKAQRRAAQGRQGALDLHVEVAGLQTPLIRALAEIDTLPTDTAEQLADKERRFADYQRSLAMHNARTAADAWCAAFVAPKTQESAAISERVVRRLAEGKAVEPEVVELIRSLGEQYRFLHLHLAFPAVFPVTEDLDPDGSGPGWHGGFDVVIGNPPWDQIQYDPREVFAGTHPEIADAPTMAVRNRLIKALADSDSVAYKVHLHNLRATQGVQHFVHGSGRFPLTSFGRLNTAPLFAELALNSISFDGRAGLVIPSGIATDSFNQYFFSELIERRSLVSLFDFRNKGFFPDVAGAQGNRFCLLTLTGQNHPSPTMVFTFFATEIAELSDASRAFTVTPEDLTLINPNTRTAPVFRTRRDADMTKAIYRRVPVLMRGDDPDASPWGVDFGMMFMMNTDSYRFRTAAELEALGAVRESNVWRRSDELWLPLYEAKMMHHFDHRFGDYAKAKLTGKEVRQLPTPSDSEHANPAYVVQPRYWVIGPDTQAALPNPRTKWLLGYRRNTSATDERTMIVTVLPATAVGDSLFLIDSTKGPLAWLLPLLSSFAHDYCARQKLGGTNFNFFIAKQLPVLIPDALAMPCGWSPGSVADWLTPRVLELTYTAWDLAGFAIDLGWHGPPFRWDPTRRELLRAELDAAFFHLYGIERDDVAYVMDTFRIVRQNDVADYSEYRTKRLILERYDELQEAISSGTSYETVLGPPPASPLAAHDESTRPTWTWGLVANGNSAHPVAEHE